MDANLQRAVNTLLRVKRYDKGRSEHPKLFLVRTWINKPMAEGVDLPLPCIFIVAAKNLDHATRYGAAIRAVIIRLEIEGETDRVQAKFLKALLHDCAKHLDIDTAAKVFQDIGTPVLFDERYHEINDLLVVPFTTSTGFRVSTIGRMAFQVPRQQR